MNVIEVILTSFATSAALVWLTKTWISERLKNAIKHEYDQKLETHKIQLKAQADVSIERLKSELATSAAQRNVRFSRVFERTAETIAETYARLWAFYDAVGDYTSIVQSDDNPQADRRKVATEKYNQFAEYYFPRRLFFQKDTTVKIENCFRSLDHTMRRFMVEVERKGAKFDTALEWTNAVKVLTHEIPPLLSMLEDDFRQNLGMMESAKTIDSTSPVALHPPVN
jgi:hypothetical protein